MELAIAQFWSSGIGGNETTTVDFEVFCLYVDLRYLMKFRYLYSLLSVIS